MGNNTLQIGQTYLIVMIEHCNIISHKDIIIMITTCYLIVYKQAGSKVNFTDADSELMFKGRDVCKRKSIGCLSVLL